MIPKRIHYVWVGGPLPDAQRAYIDSWRETNPDYEFTLWNESNIDFSVNLIRRAYDQRKWAKVADIVRLVAVLQHGGIYLDTDIRRWCTRQIQGEMAPNPKLLRDDRLATDGVRAPGRQHPVQHRHADGSLSLLGREAAGSQTRSDQRLVTTHCRFY